MSNEHVMYKDFSFKRMYIYVNMYICINCIVLVYPGPVVTGSNPAVSGVISGDCIYSFSVSISTVIVYLYFKIFMKSAIAELSALYSPLPLQRVDFST